METPASRWDCFHCDCYRLKRPRQHVDSGLEKPQAMFTGRQAIKADTATDSMESDKTKWRVNRHTQLTGGRRGRQDKPNNEIAFYNHMYKTEIEK